MKGAAGAAVVLLLVGVAGCGTTDPNVEFAQQMIPHHEQALEMAALVAVRSADPDVEALAAKIEAAQAPEIEQMQTWLAQWGESEVDDAHGGHGSEHGMMTAEQMAALETATGAEFDDLWLEMMIDHHEGAIVMAEEVLAQSSDPQVEQLAQDVIAAQTAETEQMTDLLAQ